MKLDRAFFKELGEEVTRGEKEYRNKHFRLFVLATLALWGAYLLLAILFPILAVFAFHPLGILLLLSPTSFYFVGKSSARHTILRNVVESYGGQYRKESADLDAEKALMLRRRESFDPKIGHQSIRGAFTHWAGKEFTFKNDSGKRVRLFEYAYDQPFTNEYGGHRYWVLGVSTANKIPHIYINYRRNKHNLNIGRKLSLPTEFEKEFDVSVPEGYQLEGLQVFTPDVMHEILNLPFRCDIELVDGEMLFFIENIKKLSTDLVKLGEQVEGAQKILSLMSPKIESLRWSQVGDRSYNM